SDSNDEFVELYNPNSTSANLEDYQLQTGSSFKTKATLSDIVIAPGQYLVLYSRDFNVGLSNNGGAARLLDPNGQVVSDSQAYTNATSGDSWARFDSGWQWTGSPTPGAANVLSTSAAAAKKASKVKTATAKAKKAKKAAAAKKGKKAKDKATQAVTAPASIPTSPLSIGLVATAAGLALVYGAYEFRHDIRNKFHILKRYITHRFHSGP
ncbi:lamin tail domain-containing protein, partial [Candidatus Microgenomates bacterium]|nr:lamin tail domain-containing protein [Candidatus Microgenomates bacterium]